MDFNAQVQNISSDQLDALFAGTPSAKDLVVGEDKNADTKTDDVVDASVIPQIDMDKFGEDTSATDDSKTDDVKDDKTQDDGKQTDKKDDEKSEDKKDELTDEEKSQTSAILKTTVNYLIDKGIWKDFDEKDNIEFTDEVYAELSAKQAEVKVTEMFEELVDSTGDYGKAIISHIKNGGNPDEIIDLFKEQKQMQSFDISQEDGQKSLVEKYYSDVVGWSKKKVDEFIQFKQGTEDGLESEAKEVQEKFDALYSKQLQQIEAQRKAEEKQIKEQQEQYINTLSTEIDKFESFTDNDKKLVKDSLLKFNKKLKDGTKVNDFYVKFYEIQNDPKEYIELVHYVMDKAGYKQKVKVQEQGELVKKSWNFVKGNAAVSKKGGSDNIQQPSNKASKIDFGTLFKNK